jgi:hypothetical protein
MQRESVGNDLPRLSPFDPATMVQVLDDRGQGLRVVFFRSRGAADRWGHVVAAVANGDSGETAVPCLISREGSGGDGWPASPPLQSLAMEARPGGRVALLVGMWGQHHWSASFEVINSERRLRIDIACRIAAESAAASLGSTYETRVPAAMDSEQLVLDLGGKRRVLVAFGPETEGKVASDEVFLGPGAQAGRLVRWKYELLCG